MEKERYLFELNIDLNSIVNYKEEIWGAAYVWYGNMGVEYNLCIDEEENRSAIYKMYNPGTDWWTTDGSIFTPYEINPDHADWEKELKKAMIDALKEFFGLDSIHEIKTAPKMNLFMITYDVDNTQFLVNAADSGDALDLAIEQNLSGEFLGPFDDGDEFDIKNRKNYTINPIRTFDALCGLIKRTDWIGCVENVMLFND